MPAVYSIDLIAKRDKKKKMDRSIIKGWNAHYQTLEEVEEETRLKKKKAEEERAKLEEKESLEEAESDETEIPSMEQMMGEGLLKKSAYNAKTGSFSGHYGKAPVKDENAKQQIQAILTEKADVVGSVISAMQQNDTANETGK